MWIDMLYKYSLPLLPFPGIVYIYLTQLNFIIKDA